MRLLDWRGCMAVICIHCNCILTLINVSKGNYPKTKNTLKTKTLYAKSIYRYLKFAQVPVQSTLACPIIDNVNAQTTRTAVLLLLVQNFTHLLKKLLTICTQKWQELVSCGCLCWRYFMCIHDYWKIRTVYGRLRFSGT